MRFIYNLNLFEALVIGLGMVIFAIIRKRSYMMNLKDWLSSFPSVPDLHLKSINAYEYVASYTDNNDYKVTSIDPKMDIFKTSTEITIEPRSKLRYHSQPVFDFSLRNTGKITFKKVAFYFQEYDKFGPVNQNLFFDYFINDLRPNEKKNLIVPVLEKKKKLKLEFIQIFDVNDKLLSRVDVEKQFPSPPFNNYIPFSLIALPIVGFCILGIFERSNSGLYSILFILSLFLFTRAMGGAIFSLLAIGIGFTGLMLGSNFIFLLCMLFIALAYGRFKSPIDLINPSLANKRL